MHQALLGSTTPVVVGSIRVNAHNDHMEPSTLPSSVTAVTFCGWVKMVTDRNDWSTVFAIEDGSNWNEVITDTDGTSLKFHDNTGERLSVGTMTVGVWYFVATAMGDATVNCFFAEEGATSLTKTTSAKTNLGTIDTATIASTQVSEWFNGEFARCRIWNATLSDAEVLAEYLSVDPVRTTDIVGSWPMNTGVTALDDTSGQANDLTDPSTSGSWTDGIGPVIGPV